MAFQGKKRMLYYIIQITSVLPLMELSNIKGSYIMITEFCSRFLKGGLKLLAKALD